VLADDFPLAFYDRSLRTECFSFTAASKFFATFWAKQLVNDRREKGDLRGYRHVGVNGLAPTKA
jgi:hypothetical protein